MSTDIILAHKIDINNINDKIGIYFKPLEAIDYPQCDCFYLPNKYWFTETKFTTGPALFRWRLTNKINE